LTSFHEDAAPDHSSDTVAPMAMLIPNNGWVSIIGAESTAPATFKIPCPSTKGFPTGPGLVVASSVPFTALGE
jgi:hypothetical protein